MAVVAGEAGGGKSRLGGELERRAREAGFHALHGESIEFGGDAFAYAPVAAALGDLPREWLMQAAGAETRAALSGLVPGAGDDGSGVAAGRRCVLLTDLLGRF